MKVTIQSIYGALISLDCESKNTILDVKKKLEEKLNVKKENQELQYLAQKLQDQDVLEELQIVDNAIILFNVLNKDCISIAKNERLLFGSLEPIGNYFSEKSKLVMQTNIVTTPNKNPPENKSQKIVIPKTEEHYIKNEPIITGTRKNNEVQTVIPVMPNPNSDKGTMIPQVLPNIQTLPPVNVTPINTGYPPIRGTIQNTPAENTDADNIMTIVQITGCDPEDATRMYVKCLKNTQLAINKIIEQTDASTGSKKKKR